MNILKLLICLWASVDVNDCEFRYDSSGFITIFNKKIGMKIRTKTYENKEPEISDIPELVDLSITDYCEENCEFCYKNSGCSGKHADMKVLNNIIYQMGNAGVFEIAIGGGDPVSHPEFSKILYKIKNSGIVPSFSTRSTKWLDNGEIVKSVKENCGAVAFSVRNAKEVKSFIAKSEKVGIKPSLHFVLGGSDLKNIPKIMDLRDRYEKLIILGFKNIGRGKDFTPYSTKGWIDILNEYKWSKVGVDASLAEVLRKESSIPQIYIRKEDGVFSMYNDAVENTASFNSFSEDKIKCDKKPFEEIWREVRKTN